MDDLTPMDPEYREAPPETPQETPCYYGTGRQPEKRPSHFPIILVLICLLTLANLVTVFALLELKRTQTAQRPVTKNNDELVAVLPTQDPHTGSEPLQNTASGEQMVLHASDGALSLRELYQKVMPGVVTVLAGDTHAGAGVVLSADGYIITNARTVQADTALRIRTNDGDVYDARLVGADSASDLAVLKADGVALTPVEFGDSDELQPGDSVVAISNPFGQELSATMSQGIIAAVNDDIELSGRKISILQTDAALDAASAGGPLFNDCGQVIGFNVDRVGALVSYETVSGIGFAIPTRDAKAIVMDLIADGCVSGRVTLGLTVRDIPSGARAFWKLPYGVMVYSIETDSAAYRAGLRTGDVILQLDDTAVQSAEDFDSALGAYQAGQTVRVFIYRGGSRYYADLVLQDAKSA